ncbi:MAG: hypothetical protein ACOCXJ_06135, partial [Planctomycetota bacterium]
VSTAVIIATDGGLGADNKPTSFWQRCLAASIEGHSLPIVVLGPVKAPQERQVELHAQLDQLAEWLRQRHPELPMIDLRQVRLRSDGAWYPGAAEAAAERIRIGLQEYFALFE